MWWINWPLDWLVLQAVLRAVLCQEDPQVQQVQQLRSNFGSKHAHQRRLEMQKSVCPKGWWDWKVPRSLDPNLRRKRWQDIATDLNSLVTLVLQRAMQIYAVDQQRNLEPLLCICMHLYSCQLLNLRSVFTALLTHCLNISFRTMGCRFSSMTSVKVNLPNSPPLRLASLGMTWSRYKKRIDKSSVSSRSMVPLSKRL